MEQWEISTLINYQSYIHINKRTDIYIYIYVGDERTPEPSLWNFGKTPSIVI